MKFSLLDRSRTRVGQSDGQAVHDVIERARHAEDLGYHRFWVAEHHAVPGIASGSPAVLLAALGQVTDRIRLGSGGVMLPQHQPLIVAEQFRLLEALYRDRIDLGIGRSLGFTAPVRRALRQEDQEPEDYANDLRELLGYLEDTGAVTARPVTNPVPVFTLATKSGMKIAADLGLPVVIGGPIVRSPELPGILDEYRRSSANPYVVVSLDAYVAGTEEEARNLALPEAWAMAMSRRNGEFPPLESPADILAQRWSGQVEERVGKQLQSVLAGTPDQVGAELLALAERTGADEFLFSTSTHDIEALKQLDDALIQVCWDIFSGTLH